MRFARNVFLFAFVEGVLILVPMFFLEARIGIDTPPPITHPEYYYGFLSVALAWQVAFLVIARDPLRFRPLMIPAVLEKWIYGLVVAVLFAQARVDAYILGAAVLDASIGALFVAAYLRTGRGEAA